MSTVYYHHLSKRLVDTSIRGVVTLLFTFILSTCLLFSSAHAAPEIPLPVDEYNFLEGGMIEVRIGNVRRIVRESDALLHIVDRYLGFRLLDERVRPQALEAFLVRSGAGLSSVELGRTLALLLRQTDYRGERYADILTQLKLRDDRLQVLQSLFQSYEGAIPVRREIHELLFELLRMDLEWVNRELSSRARSDRFREFLVERYRLFVRQGEFEEASELVDAVGILFGADSQSHRDLVGLRGRVLSSRRLLEQDSVQDLILLIRRVREDPEVGSLLDELTLQRVHRRAEELLERGDSSLALTLLAELDPRERTPTTLRLLKKAVTELRVDDSDSPLFSTTNFEIVREMTEGSYPVREKVLSYLDAQTLHFLSLRNYDFVLRAFELARVLRPDPSARNDRIRFKLGLQYLNDGRRAAAEAVFAERRSRFSVGEIIELGRAGYYSQRLVGSVLLLFLLVGVLVLFLVRGGIQRRRGETEHNEEGGRDSSDQSLGRGASEARLSRGFERVALRQGLDPRIQEYRLLLHRLGVGPEADIQVIKATYRQRLKKLHPDLQSGGEGGDRSEFYKLKETYEKILQLRERLELKEAEEES